VATEVQASTTASTAATVSTGRVQENKCVEECHAFLLSQISLAHPELTGVGIA